jgi:CheY-like chemotaxis protein
MMDKVLVVDDEQAFCRVIRDLLDMEGYRVVVAYSSDEALEKYSQEKPDVVIMDLRMPGKGGIATLRELKEIDPAVNVVVVSAVINKDIIQQVEDEGALYLRKPVNFLHLVHAISTKLGKPA